MSLPVLVGDIGGTHARFALADAAFALSDIRVYASADFVDAAQLIERYRREVGVAPIGGCCVAVAGPVSEGRGKLTNGDVLCDAREIAALLQCRRALVINDFTAVGHALPVLPAAALRTIGPDLEATGTLAVIGPGTGLGMGFVVPDGKRWRVLPSEGGHGNLAASDPLELEVLGLLLQRFHFVSWETVLSGPGLVNLYQAVCQVWGCAAEVDDPAAITARAQTVADPVCHQTLELFCNLLGTAAGTLALTVCATGGVYLAGGILPQLHTFLAASQFRRHFEARGLSTGYVKAIPTRLVMAADAGLLGAAAAFADADR